MIWSKSLDPNSPDYKWEEALGVPTSGFGRIDASSVSGQRNGQGVARVEW
jgi:hypothetical protein